MASGAAWPPAAAAAVRYTKGARSATEDTDPHDVATRGPFPPHRIGSGCHGGAYLATLRHDCQPRCVAEEAPARCPKRTSCVALEPNVSDVKVRVGVLEADDR